MQASTEALGKEASDAVVDLVWMSSVLCSTLGTAQSPADTPKPHDSFLGHSQL